MCSSLRFLILTSDSGFGHRSAAQSVAKALSLLDPKGVDCTVVNPISTPPVSPFLQRVETSYDHTVTHYPSWYRLMYEISDTRQASTLMENTLTRALHKNVRRLVEDVKPHVIVSTNQMLNAPTGAALQTLPDRPPFFTIVTDLADVHSMWFNHAPNSFFVATEEIRRKAIGCGISPRQIMVSGIPVDPLFAFGVPDRAALRVRLGLDPELPMFLYAASRRVSGVMAYLKALEAVREPFQLVLTAGGDTDLYAQATSRNWRYPISIHNYITNMPEWMLCADALLTKAGGLILSEGLAAGLPIALVGHLPGQEEGNVRFILKNRAGVRADRPAELSSLMNRWLSEEREGLRSTAARACAAGRPEAALEIGRVLWRAAADRQAKRDRQMDRRMFISI